MCQCEWSQVWPFLNVCLCVQFMCVCLCVHSSTVTTVRVAMTTLTFQSACPALIPSPAVTAPGPPAE